MSDVVRDRLVARRAISGDGPFVFPSISRSGYLSEPKVGLAAVVAATGIKVLMHELRRRFITVAESTEMSPCALKAWVNESLGVYRRRRSWLPQSLFRGPAAERLRRQWGVVPAGDSTQVGLNHRRDNSRPATAAIP
jgi:hypothetical protein